MLISFMDLFRLLVSKKNPGAIVDLSTVTREAFLLRSKMQRGLVQVGVHMCSFDLSLLAAAGLFPAIQALPEFNPKGSSLAMNELRASYGLQITPLSANSLREAVTTLRQEGVVDVAADIPLENSEELFFSSAAKPA